jgi:hypothetical protein
MYSIPFHFIVVVVVGWDIHTFKLNWMKKDQLPTNLILFWSLEREELSYYLSEEEW